MNELKESQMTKDLRPVDPETLSLQGICMGCNQLKDLFKFEGGLYCTPCVEQRQVGFGEDVDLHEKFIRGPE